MRWSSQILDETQRAVEKIMTARAISDGAERAFRSRQKMETAFPEALVEDYAVHMPLGQNLPDLGDAHVLAAAVRTQAQTIVTENLKDFPSAVLLPLNLEARTADTFIADTIALDEGRAIQAIKQMLLRLRLPEKTADALLRDCEAHGLLATATVLDLSLSPSEARLPRQPRFKPGLRSRPRCCGAGLSAPCRRSAGR